MLPYGMAKGPIVEKREITAIRIPPSQKREIKRRAEAARLTFTEYMIRSALGESIDPSSTAERLDALEQKVARIEELAYTT